MKKKQILIVEDERVVADDIKMSVERLGYGVCGIAISGEEAIKKAEEICPDLVLMDIVLEGEMDGIEAASIIRSRFDIPVVYLTAYADNKTLERAKITEPFGYILKPFEDRELKSIIEIALYKHRMEKELKTSKAGFDNIVEKSTDGIIIVNKEGIVRYVNPNVELIFNRKKDDLIGEYFGFPLSSGGSIEIDINRRNREPGIGEMRVIETAWEDRRAYLVLINDITEHKRAEEKQKKLYNELKESQAQLIQTEKMSALGKMTAGLAHELNNPMMSILNFVQYCLKHSSTDSRIYPVLQDAESETHRCIDIIQNLLTFSRMEQEGEEAFQKESLAVIFDRVFKILSSQIKEQHISVTQQVTKGTPKIWVRANNMQQIFFNLISNALDALKKSKRKEIHIDIRREGEFVQVTVADTGCGIAPENLQKIFDPFFTTKSVGEGTGLGLSICQSIIKAHGGKITWESELGKGTKFKIFLAIEKRKYKGETENEKKYSNN